MIHRLIITIVAPTYEKIHSFVLRIWFPRFIRNVEPYFLLNSPRLWISRFYYVLYHVSLVSLTALSIAFVYPASPYSMSTVWLILYLFLLIEFTLVIDWSKAMFRYNIEKEYGDTNLAQGWLEITICILCLAFLVMPSYVSYSIFRVRMSRIVSQGELVSFIAEHQNFLADVNNREVIVCEEALAQTNSEDHLINFELIEQYSGNAVRNYQEAEANYCSAVDNAFSIHNFVYRNDSSGLRFFYAFHLILIFGGAWFIFSCKLVRETPSEYFGNFFTLSLTFIFLYGIVILLPELINPNLAIELAARYNLLALASLVWIFSLSILAEIVFVIDRQKTYSTLSSQSLTLFPPALVLSSYMLSSVLGANILSVSTALTISVTVCFLLIPYLKGQFIKLLSLPEN